MEEEYKPNSYKARSEAAKAEAEANSKKTEDEKPSSNNKRIVQGEVKIRKPNEFREFVRAFIVDDIRNVAKKAVYDFFIPSLKATFYKTLTNGLGMLFGINPDSAGNVNATKVAYTQFSAKNTSTNQPSPSENKTRSAFNLSDIIIPTRYEAEAVIERIHDLLNSYGVVSVTDVYEMINVDVPYTLVKYGWKSLPTNIVPYPVDGGYVIRLPKPIVID